MLLYGETDTTLTPKLIVDAQTGTLDTINCVTGKRPNDIYFNNKNNTLVFNTTHSFRPEHISIFTLSGKRIVNSTLQSWTNKSSYIIPLKNFWKYPVTGKYILQLRNGKEEKRMPIVIE